MATRAHRASTVFGTIGSLIMWVGAGIAWLTLLGGIIYTVWAWAEPMVVVEPLTIMLAFAAAVAILVQTVVLWAIVTVAAVVTGYVAHQVTR